MIYIYIQGVDKTYSWYFFVSSVSLENEMCKDVFRRIALVKNVMD